MASEPSAEIDERPRSTSGGLSSLAGAFGSYRERAAAMLSRNSSGDAPPPADAPAADEPSVDDPAAPELSTLGPLPSTSTSTQKRELSTQPSFTERRCSGSV